MSPNPSRFQAHHGFIRDPFGTLDADHDDPDLFEVPPGFPTQTAGPLPPVQFIFGALGSGKTAFRRLLGEEKLSPDEYLVTTYDTSTTVSDAVGTDGAKYPSLEAHLNEIEFLLLLTLLREVRRTGGQDAGLTFERQSLRSERETLRRVARRNHGRKELVSLRPQLAKLQGKSGTIVDWVIVRWSPIETAIRTVAAVAGKALPVHASQTVPNNPRRVEWEQFAAALETVSGRRPVVLVDSIDEQEGITTAAQIFERVRPLVTNVGLLKSAGASFWFFLSDEVLRDQGAALRLDKLAAFTLEWTPAELRALVHHRLMKASESRVTNLNQLFCEHALDHELIICYLAAGKPRRLMRICEQLLRDPPIVTAVPECISAAAEAAVFSAEARTALEGGRPDWPDLLGQLKQLPPSFTVNDLGKTLGSSPTTSTVLKNLESAGLLRRAGERVKADKGARPDIWTFRDVVVLAGSVDEATLVSTLVANTSTCACGALVVVGPDPVHCPDCQKVLQARAPLA